MSKIQIFRKSAKGAEAIATRQHGLSPKQRSMLILIDGKRNTEELQRLSAVLGDTAQLMAELTAGGFIEPTEIDAATPPLRAAPEEPSPESTRLPLADARRFASRALTDLMGPMAEQLCLRIESARDAAEFQAAVTRAELTLREVRGAGVASSFAAAVANHSPA